MSAVFWPCRSIIGSALFFCRRRRTWLWPVARFLAGAPPASEFFWGVCCLLVATCCFLSLLGVFVRRTAVSFFFLAALGLHRGRIGGLLGVFVFAAVGCVLLVLGFWAVAFRSVGAPHGQRQRFFLRSPVAFLTVLELRLGGSGVFLGCLLAGRRAVITKAPPTLPPRLFLWWLRSAAAPYEGCCKLSRQI